MRRLATFGVAILVTAAVLGAAPALAEHFRNEPGLYFGDDRDGTIDFQQCELTTKYHDAWHLNNDHDIEPTDVVVTTGHTCDNLDVRVNDWDYGANGKAGWWECHSVAGDGVTCDTGHVHINLNTTKTDGEALHILCQEIGHSVGLGHRPDATTATCMDNSDSWDKRHLDAHDSNVINSNH